MQSLHDLPVYSESSRVTYRPAVVRCFSLNGPVNVTPVKVRLPTDQ